MEKNSPTFFVKEIRAILADNVNLDIVPGGPIWY